LIKLKAAKYDEEEKSQTKLKQTEDTIQQFLAPDPVPRYKHKTKTL
jgi:hypothetical protein